MDIKLNHIALRVKDIKETYEWFNKYFSFNRIIPPGIVPMKASNYIGFRCCISNDNGDVLELEEYAGEGLKELNVKGTLTHISFTVDSVSRFYELLLGDGILKSNELVRDMGPVKILYFEGINDLEIELIEVKDRKL